MSGSVKTYVGSIKISVGVYEWAMKTSVRSMSGSMRTSEEF